MEIHWGFAQGEATELIVFARASLKVGKEGMKEDVIWRRRYVNNNVLF